MKLQSQIINPVLCLLFASLTACSGAYKTLGEDCPDFQGTWFLAASEVSGLDGTPIDESISKLAQGEEGETLTISQSECKEVNATFRGKTYRLVDDDDAGNSNWQEVNGIISTDSVRPVSITYTDEDKDAGITVIVHDDVVLDGVTQKVLFSGQFLTKKEFTYKHGIEALLNAEETERKKLQKENEELKKRIEELTQAPSP
jgi:hypothetical protein